MTQKLLHAWPIGLLCAIALLFGWIGLATDGRDRVLGLVGALAILAALAIAHRSIPAAAALLLAGTLPLAITTWWSITTPLLAVLALALALPALRAADPASGSRGSRR